MKKLMLISALILTVATVSAQKTRTAADVDDLYGTVDRRKVAKQDAAAKELRKQKAEQQRAYQQRVQEEEVYMYEDEENSFDAVLSDSYEESYARRLRGFQSPSYRMPSSYYNFRYGNDSFYTSAYDPAFYNTIVMGDQVWVEPRYVTAMFGTWGTPYMGIGLYGPNFGFSVGSPWWGGGYYGGNSWCSPYYGWNSWNNNYWGHGYGYGYYPSWGHGHGHYPSWGGGNRPYYRNDVVYGGRRGEGVGSSRYPNNSSSGYRRGSSGLPTINNGNSGYNRPGSGNNNSGYRPSGGNNGNQNSGYSREELLRKQNGSSSSSSSYPSSSTTVRPSSSGSSQSGGTSRPTGGSSGGGGNRGRR